MQASTKFQVTNTSYTGMYVFQCVSAYYSLKSRGPVKFGFIKVDRIKTCDIYDSEGVGIIEHPVVTVAIVASVKPKVHRQRVVCELQYSTLPVVR
jgi:hypothetical protein